MSLGISKLNFVQTIDRRIDVEKLHSLLYGIESTATENTYQVFPIQNQSISGFTIVANPPNRNVFVNKKFYVKEQFTINFTGVAGDGLHLLQAAGMNHLPGVDPGNQYYDAPRAYPLANALNSLQVSLNGDQVTTNLNQYVRALTRYHNDRKDQDMYESFTPKMLDQFLQYADGIGFARSELRGYGDNVYQLPRGGFPTCTMLSNTSTTASVLLEIIEPLYISPLNLSPHEEQASFLQLDTVTLVGTFGGRGNSSQGGLIASLWSHAIAPITPSTITSTNIQIGDGSALFQYMTPPLDMVLPPSITYSFVDPIYYATESQTSVPAAPALGSQTTLPLQNINLTSVPSMMYIWVSQRDRDNTFSSTDTYFSIENINITFNNRTGILANAQPSDLYNITQRHNCNSNFRQFRKDVGAVICLRFGSDIPLANLVSAGARGTFNISAQVQCTNNYSTAVFPTLSVLFVHTGTYTISNGKCYREIGLLTENDILNVKSSGVAPIPAPHMNNALGGLAWSDVVSFFKKLGRAGINVAKKVVPVLAPEFMPVVQGADVLARTAGFGKMKGGRKLTRAQMLRMMK